MSFTVWNTFRQLKAAKVNWTFALWNQTNMMHHEIRSMLVEIYILKRRQLVRRVSSSLTWSLIGESQPEMVMANLGKLPTTRDCLNHDDDEWQNSVCLGSWLSLRSLTIVDCQSQIPHIKPPCFQVCRQIWHFVVNLSVCIVHFQVIWGPGKFGLNKKVLAVTLEKTLTRRTDRWYQS